MVKINRWSQLQYRYSIKYKLIIVFLSISLTSLLFMAFIAHNYYAEATKRDFFNVANSATTSLQYQMEVYLQQIMQSTFSTIAGPLPWRSEVLGQGNESGIIQEWLKSEGDFTSNRSSIVEDILRNEIVLSFEEIQGVYLMSRSKHVISTTSTLANPLYENDPWFTFPFTGERKVLSTYRSSVNNTPVFPLIIPINDTDTVKLIGRLVIEISLEQIENMIGRTRLGETGYFFVVAEDGTIVYHPKFEWLGENLQDTDLSELRMEDNNESQQWKGEDYLISYSHSDQLDWNVVAVVPFDEMASGLNIARNSTLIALLFLCTAVILFVPLLSGWIVRPMIQLKNVMRQMQRGDLTARTKVYQGNDEIQILNNSFNLMADQLNNLMDTIYKMKLEEMQLQLRQKEAMIQALQNQINPHFLYNTLDIIKSVAFLSEVPIIEKIALNLAEVYRYTAKPIPLEVRLEEELNYLRNYLEIIHIRFPDHFQSEIYIHDKFLDCSIVKLTLQPLIENAVKYAVEPQEGKTAVIVSAYENGEELIVEIADNGPGFEAETLKEINERIAYISEHKHDEAAHERSYGITNVHARLVLKYGASYGLQIDSFTDRGTVISMRVPLKRIK